MPKGTGCRKCQACVSQEEVARHEDSARGLYLGLCSFGKTLKLGPLKLLKQVCAGILASGLCSVGLFSLGLSHWL
ncbi:hypothetical protein ACE6H2_023158 [Prunus campanulata]